MCSLVDCSSGVGVRLGSPHEKYAEEMPLEIDACVAGDCRTWIVDKNASHLCTGKEPTSTHYCFVKEESISLLLSHNEGPGDVPVAVTIRSKDGATLFEGQETVKLEPLYPNGYECDKNSPCYSGSADFSSLSP